MNVEQHSKARNYRWRLNNREQYLANKKAESLRARARRQGLTVDEHVALRSQPKQRPEPDPVIVFIRRGVYRQARARCPVLKLLTYNEMKTISARIRYYLNPDNERERVARYKALHPEQRREDSLRRYQLQSAAGDSITDPQWLAMLDAHDHRCHWCGESNVELTKDHVIPISKGGECVASNIVPSCLPCNASRGNRHAVPPRLRMLRWVESISVS